MNRTISFIGIFLLLFLASFSNMNGNLTKAGHNDLEGLNLKGRIHNMCECLFDGDVKSDKIFKTSEVAKKTDSTWFDKKGNKLSEKIYSATGKIITEWNYTYDENENLTQFTYLIKGKQRQRDVYKYDSAGRVAEWDRYKGLDSLFEKDTYKYDADGHQNEEDVEEHYPVKQYLKRFFDFDNAGNKTKEREFCLGRSEIDKNTWKYDEEGRVIEEDEYSSFDAVKTKVVYAYKGEHLVEKRIQLEDGTVTSREVYTYNAKGEKAAVDMYNNLGKLYHYYTYSYDLKGSIKEEKEFKVFADNVPQLENDDTYELSYDKTGNWVKKSDLKLDGTVTITERGIAYY